MKLSFRPLRFELLFASGGYNDPEPLLIEYPGGKTVVLSEPVARLTGRTMLWHDSDRRGWMDALGDLVCTDADAWKMLGLTLDAPGGPGK
jgi:hypothetical protein